MKIKDSVVLVTGANRGLGLAFAKELLARGARKVYAGARNPASVKLDGVVPVKLDVTSEADIAALAKELGDVDFVVNNAGIFQSTPALSQDAEQALRAEMEVNFYGPLRVSRAFAPVLAKNGGGAILNVLSVLSWIALPTTATYSVSKSAAWALTNALRGELAAQQTQVVGLHVGYMDTDMVSSVTAPKSDPRVVAAATLDVVEAGGSEVLADDISKQVKGGLSSPAAPYLGMPA